MARESSDVLFQLIRSLTKSEKRYFKLFANRSGDPENMKFVKLFNLIEKQTVYDEEKILAKEISLKPEQISNMKAHLYKQILQSLKLCNNNHVIDFQIRDHIDHAQLLYNKCLYQQCVKLIDKAKKLAMRNDRSVLLLEILELEKLVVSQTIASNNEKRVSELVTETEIVAESIKNINIFSNLAIKLNSYYINSGFIRNKKDFERVERFFYTSLPRYEEEKLSFHEKLYLYYSYVGYCFYIQDFDRGYDYARRWVQLFDSHPEMIEPKLEMYIKGLNNLMVAQSKLLKYAEFLETNKKLENISFLPNIFLTDHITLTLFKYSYTHAINRHFMLGDFKGGITLVQNIKDGLDKFISKLDKHSVLIFYYKIACLYFGSDNYRQALVWLNKIINSKAVDLREDIHSFARILNLICHFELGNTDLVEYQVKSTYRFLLNKGNLGIFQKIILRFLKKLTGEINDQNLIPAFKALKEELLPIAESPYDKKAFIYFDIISWLESKIEGRPVEEIIREKALKRIGKLN